MKLSHKGEVEAVKTLNKLLASVELIGTDAVICPSFPSLDAVARELTNSSKLAVGAQAVYWEDNGAYTGSVSLAQISPSTSNWQWHRHK